MHISEGILSPPVLAVGWAVTAGLLTLSLRRLRENQLPRMAVFASAFFLASLVRVPIGAASAHFALLGLMGLTLGWGAFAAIFMALILQSLLFQFGGLASLGVNACIMGVPALLAHVCFGRMAALGKGRTSTVSAFLAGALPIFAGTGGIFAALSASNAALAATGTALWAASLPLAFMEGVVTLFAVGFLRRVAPDMLAGSTAGTATANPKAVHATV